MFEYTYISPIGPLLIIYDDAHIFGVKFDKYQSLEYLHNNLIEKCVKQLDEYFAGRRRDFELPLKPAGTPFQESVWWALTKIPYGEIATYGEIAATVGNAKASRAVGGANNKNPIAVIIPCHRVIGAGGKLVGYGGGLDKKIHLLELEGYDTRMS